MHEGHTALLLQLEGIPVRVVIYPGYKAYLRAVASGRLDLGYRRSSRQAYGCGYAVGSGGESDALGVVSGGAGDDSLLPFIFGKLGNHISGTPDLERAGDLEILRLEVDILAVYGGLDEIGLAYHVLQDVGSPVYVVE